MRINYTRLITEFNAKNPGKRMTKTKLAQELVANDFYNSEGAAINMMRNSEKHISKGVSWDMLKFLTDIFKVQASELIEWEN